MYYILSLYAVNIDGFRTILIVVMAYISRAIVWDQATHDYCKQLSIIDTCSKNAWHMFAPSLINHHWQLPRDHHYHQGRRCLMLLRYVENESGSPSLTMVTIKSLYDMQIYVLIQIYEPLKHHGPVEGDDMSYPPSGKIININQ